jgi:signal transduction histidine kinase
VPESLRVLQLRDGRPALAFIPLLAHGQRVGVIVLSSATIIQWPESELRMYQVTAAHLAATIESRRQQFQLSRREQQLAVLEERQRLARELHDSVTQLVFSVTLIAQSISPAWRRDPAEGERRVQRLLELSQSAFSELRALLAELRPPEPTEPQPATDTRIPDLVLLQRDGLVGALRRRVQELTHEGLQIVLDAEGYPPAGHRPPAVYEETLYRVAQEALNNVQKHAHARSVQVRLSAMDEVLQLRVCDDGRGFDVRAAQSTPGGLHGGMGLRAMRERVDALRGTLQVTSTPGTGTSIDVEFPIAKAVP